MHCKLFFAFQFHAGIKAAVELANYLKPYFIQTRFIAGNPDVWPPEQPKQFTALALICHKRQPSKTQTIEIAKAITSSGDVNIVMAATPNYQPIFNYINDQNYNTLRECLQESKATKSLSEILTPLEETNHGPSRMVLIKGAPGLGKTVLMKQIAYQWACGKLLTSSNLVFLVCLRDPAVHRMKNINDLVDYFFPREKVAIKQAEICATYLRETNGQNLTLLLDGFDEYPEELRTNSFVAMLIQHKELPLASMVISSRPHACEHLQNSAVCCVDILGFAKEDQQQYIQEALKDKPAKVEQLLKYCEDHPYISSLCYIPFNLAVLLYLYKQGLKLPNGCTELYNYFICHTICHFLTKNGLYLEELEDITDLDSLPQPISKILKNLSNLCLNALDKNQLVFTLKEVKRACPDICEIPGAIDGFGLMQAVKHFNLMGTTTVTLNFIHHSIQEYLAAYSIISLPYDQQLQLLKDKFWSSFYSTTFAMYVGMTKGQGCSFKIFLYDRCQCSNIPDRVFEDGRKCLWLFKCFYEAHDDKMCGYVDKKLFRNGHIILSKGPVQTEPLLVRDTLCLALFLSKSIRREWQQLNLSFCHISDAGMRVLHQVLVKQNITIESIDLACNSLTSLSTQALCDIVNSCNTKRLNISNNPLGDGDWLECITTLTLERLLMQNINLSSAGADRLFSALRKSNSPLEYFDISDNSISE